MFNGLQRSQKSKKITQNELTYFGHCTHITLTLSNWLSGVSQWQNYLYGNTPLNPGVYNLVNYAAYARTAYYAVLSSFLVQTFSYYTDQHSVDS